MTLQQIINKVQKIADSTADDNIINMCNELINEIWQHKATPTN